MEADTVGLLFSDIPVSYVYILQTAPLTGGRWVYFCTRCFQVFRLSTMVSVLQS